MNRRLLTFTLLTFLLTPFFSKAQFFNELFIPDTLDGTTFNLDMRPGSVSFLPGDTTDTYGINQDYLGPTLIMNAGDFVQMNVTNSIADTITMHWHGMHVAPEDDGGPHTMILPGNTWSPDFTVLDEATTFWYHPHLHSKTAEQVYKGAAGMIIVRDANEASLTLPRTYGVDDFPLILQDKTFDANNQFIFAALNDTMMVNGTLAPYLEVPAQMVRFRLLNGSNQRVYNLGFPPNIPVFMIGSDGGLLEAPLPSNRLQLAPGERAEIVVDFNNLQGNSYPVFAFNSEMDDGISGGPNGPGGGPGNPLDGVDFAVIEFRVVGQTANPVTNISTNLNTITPWNELDADVTRVKVMDQDTSGFPYYINSTPFNMMVVNDSICLDDTEIWEIYNTSDVAHPFHIHDVQFYVIEFNGGPPPPHLAGRKDVILSAPGDTIRFITKFEDFYDDTIPYMYHCHNLFHEDAGMMGQFLVLDCAVGLEDFAIQNASDKFRAYPNPASDYITISSKNNTDKLRSIEVISIAGQQVEHMEFGLEQSWHRLDINRYPNGTYLIRVEDDKGELTTLRFIKIL